MSLTPTTAYFLFCEKRLESGKKEKQLIVDFFVTSVVYWEENATNRAMNITPQFIDTFGKWKKYLHWVKAPLIHTVFTYILGTFFQMCNHSFYRRWLLYKARYSLINWREGIIRSPTSHCFLQSWQNKECYGSFLNLHVFLSGLWRRTSVFSILMNWVFMCFTSVFARYISIPLYAAPLSSYQFWLR